MFGRKQGGNVNPGCGHQVDIALSVAVHAGLIGDEADSLAAQRSEMLLGENVQAGQHLAFGLNHAV